MLVESTRAPCSVQETSCCMNPGRCLVEPPVRRWNNSGSMVDGWHFTTIFSWYLGIIRRCLLWKSFPGGAWLQSQADWHFSCCWSLVPWRWRVTQSCNLLLVLCAQVGNPEMSWPGWLIINGDTATNLHSSNMPRLPTYCLPSDANYRNERSTSIHVLLWPSFAIHRQVLKTCFHKMGVRISWRLGYWTRWWFQIFFIFTTILGRFPLTNIFQMGWNHQPVNQCRPRQQFHHVVAMLGFVALPPMLWTLTKLHPGERRLPELWCYVGISVQMMEMYGNTNATNQHLCFLQVFLLQSLTLELRHLGWICIPIGLVLAGAFKDLADLTFQHSQSAEWAFNVLRCLVVLVVGVAWSLAMAAMKCTSVRAGGIISILAIQGQMGQVVECPLLCCEWKTTGWLISWFCGMAYMKIWGPADQVLLQCDDFWIKIGLCGSFQGNCSLFLRSPGERKENLNDTSRWSEGHWVL